MAAPWISSPEMAMRDPGQGGRHRRTAMVDAARIVGCGDASSRSVATAGDRAIVGNGDAAARRARFGRLGIVGAMLEREKPPGVSEAASLHAVQGGRNRAGDQGGKPRGLMCSSATLAGFFDLSDASGPPWALLDLLLLFLDVLLLLVLLLVARHCCKVSDEAAFCLIQRPYISKTLLTRRISPRGSP
ncbi:hypothetical protein [Salmonella enterica]|uniref:hypothetical protein n=1 Tax=Salmonella enterica TaxID=28901 RepID=UPI0026AA8276